MYLIILGSNTGIQLTICCQQYDSGVSKIIEILILSIILLFLTWNTGPKWWKLIKVTVEIYVILRRSMIFGP